MSSLYMYGCQVPYSARQLIVLYNLALRLPTAHAIKVAFVMLLCSGRIGRQLVYSISC